jgi:hypothetical protein
MKKKWTHPGNHTKNMTSSPSKVTCLTASLHFPNNARSLTDASHVKNSMARFEQVIGVFG